MKDGLEELGRSVRLPRPEQMISMATDVGWAQHSSAEEPRGRPASDSPVVVLIRLPWKWEPQHQSTQDPFLCSLPVAWEFPARDEVITEGRPEDHEDRAGGDADFPGEGRREFVFGQPETSQLAIGLVIHKI